MNTVVVVLSLWLAQVAMAESKTSNATGDPGTGAAPASISGTVLETMDAAPYTYVQINTGKDKVWAAAPQFKAKVGDQISFTGGVAMRNYQSKTLNRTFDTVYFVSGINTPATSKPSSMLAQNPHLMIPGQDPHAAIGMPDPHASMRSRAKPIDLDFSGLKKADGGLTVAEVFAQKASLTGKPVRVRGKVAKYSANIMGKNWLHLQDGTGSSGSNDLTITTKDQAKVGDTVLVSGTLTSQKDIGAGYKFEVLLEDAKVTVE